MTLTEAVCLASLILFSAVFVLPVTVFLCVKLGVYAFYCGRRRGLKLTQKEETDDGPEST